MSKRRFSDDVPAWAQRELGLIIDTQDAQAEVVEKTLNGFQMDLIALRRDLNLYLNVVNAVLYALELQGTILDEQIREAGKRLMAEHNKNVQRIQAASMLGLTKTPELIKTPLQRIIDTANVGALEERREAKGRSDS